jgi:hypothetical protein
MSQAEIGDAMFWGVVLLVVLLQWRAMGTRWGDGE